MKLDRFLKLGGNSQWVMVILVLMKQIELNKREALLQSWVIVFKILQL